MFAWVVEADASPPSQVDSKASLLSIPGYDVREELARGGMGIVYRARQLEPRRTVALKMLLPHQAASPGMRERFRLEARAIAGLEHRAILPVHHVGEHNGLPFFTMKLAPGGTLAERRAEFSGEYRRIAELVATLAEAVHFAHERGVLHRDLKPGNVLFDEAGQPYVSDFGLAKLITEETNLTRSMDFLGTPHYVAPEVAAASARHATIASDIYSLGAILYELLAGRLPFEAEGLPALLKLIAEQEPVAPSAQKPDQPIPRDLEVICLRCLAKEPARRYPSALELAKDLQRWLAGEPILARETPALEKLWLWARRHRATATLILTVLALVVALVVGLTVSAIRIADSRRAALRTVEALETQKANDLFAEVETAEGLALLSRRVRSDPDNWADTLRLMSALQRRRWAIPARAPNYPLTGQADPEAARQIHFAYLPDSRLATLVIGSNLVLHDVLAQTNLHVWPLPFVPEKSFTHNDAKVAILFDSQARAWFFEFLTGQMRARTVQLTDQPGSPPLWLNRAANRAFFIAPDFSGQLVDLQTGASTNLVPAPTNTTEIPHYAVANFFLNDDRLAFSDRDRTVYIYDCATGQLSEKSFTAPLHVAEIHVSPNGRVVAVKTSDAAHFWDLESGRPLPSRQEIGVNFSPGIFRPESSQLFQGGNTLGLALFNPLNNELLQAPGKGRLLHGRAQIESNSWIAVIFDRFVGIYDLAKGQPICEPLRVVHSHHCGVASAHGRPVTLARNSQLTIWEIKTNRFEPVILRHTAGVQDARFSADGRRVITASHDNTARVWDAQSGSPIGAPMVHGDKVWSACISPNGRLAATASWDATARLWDATTGIPLSEPLRAGHFVFHVEFSPDGSRLLACGEGKVLRVYEAATGKLLLEMLHEGPLYWAHYSPDGKIIAARPLNSNPRLWNATTGALIRELPEPPGQPSTGFVTRGDFSADGSWVAFGSANSYATVWRLPEGKLHAVLNHVAVVRNAQFSPDSKTILTTSDDLTGQLWDMKTGQAISSPLKGTRSSIARPNTGNSMRAAAVHRDGRRALTGGSDGAARFWSLATGTSLAEPAEFEGSVMHAEFSPDGKRVLIACFDGTAQILTLPPIVERAPVWLAPLAEALAGQRFNDRGAVEPVTPDVLWNICQEIRHLEGNDEALAWAKELLGL